MNFGDFGYGYGPVIDYHWEKRLKVRAVMETVIFISLAVIATISILWRGGSCTSNSKERNHQPELLDRGIASPRAATVRELAKENLVLTRLKQIY